MLTHEQQPGYSWQVVTWSSDDKTIYAGRVNPPFTDADIYRIDVATGKAENLTAHQGTIRYLGSSLSPDDKTLLLSSDAHRGYLNVALLDVATKKITWVTDLKWETFPGNFSADGKRYSYVINEDGVIDPYIVDRSTTDDTKEKERLGKLWEARSDGHCFFEMVKGLGELSKIQNAINKAIASEQLAS